MPAKFDVEMTRDAMYKCLPQEITIRPELNGRHDKPDIEWLIADMLKFGQLQPVLIWNDGGEAVLAAGFSRWRAISEINKRKLYEKEPWQIKCVYVRVNEQGAFLRNISENRMRNSTTPVDDAHNIQRLIEIQQMDESEIAKVYFPVASTKAELKEAIKWVRGRIELIKLTPEAEKAVVEGRVDETAAAALAKLTSAQQKEALKKGGVVSKKDVKASAPKKNKKPRKVKIDSELKRRITAVLETADFENYDEKKGIWIEVHAEPLVALKNYTEEK